MSKSNGRKFRMNILKLLNFVPDKAMIKLQYRIKMGRKLNLKNPKRYTEKLQWYKLYYKNPLLAKCVDKFEVREFVAEKGLSNILTKCYGCYEKFDDIDLDSLPESFVLKDTLGGGGNSIIIVKDKSKATKDELNSKVKGWKDITLGKKGAGREWPYYKGKKSRILVEELLVNSENHDVGVNDYKVFCYKGKAKYVVVDMDRYIVHKRDIYDANWNNLNVVSDCPALETEAVKPENYDEMIQIAEKLSEDFPFVRVDLYNVSGKVYFGELTFYPWSGYVRFKPDEFDFVMGEEFNLPLKAKKY